MKIKVKRLKTFREKTIGLIGKEIKPVTFETRFGVHTFGVKAPIDVLILDSQEKVIALKESLSPKRIFLWNPNKKIVV